MKSLITALAIILYFNRPAFAIEPWSTQDIVLEGVYLGLLYADCEQTRIVVGRGGEETNPLLFSHPTETQIRDVCISVMFSQLAIVTLLPRWRTELIFFSIGFEGYAVRWNSHF